MTQDQLFEVQRSDLIRFNGFLMRWKGLDDRERGSGYGMGVGVITRSCDTGPGKGSYFWPGAHGTYWFNDPAENLVALVMSQQSNAQLIDDFNTLVYQAIDD